MGLACAPPALLRLSEPLAGIAPAAAACFSQLATVLFAAACDGRRAPHTIGWRGFIPLAAFRICSNILEQVVGKQHPLPSDLVASPAPATAAVGGATFLPRSFVVGSTTVGLIASCRIACGLATFAERMGAILALLWVGFVSSAVLQPR